MNSNAVILKAKRTSIGSFQGNLTSFSASELASFVIQDLLKDIRFDRTLINEIILGNVLSAGQGQAPARQAALKFLRKRLAGKRGEQYRSLPTSQKINIDKMIAKRSAMIDKFAKRLMPIVRKKETQRIQNLRKSRKEDINYEFEL